MYSLVLVSLLVSSSVVTAVTDREMLCPPWFTAFNTPTTDNTSQPYCVCNNAYPFLIKCNQVKMTSFLKFGHCAFWDATSNNTLVLASCPYVFPDHVFEDHKLQLPQNPLVLNSFTCNHLNRAVERKQCGQCTNGTGPSIGTVGIQCVQCSAVNILYHILLRYLPATLVFLFVLVVQIDITSAPMAHYVLYCNALIVFFQTSFGYLMAFAFTTPSYKYIIKVLLTLNSIWSFDPLYFLSPPLCLSRHMEDINRAYIELLATLYPFLLLFLASVWVELHARDYQLVVLVWKPILNKLIRFRQKWNPNSSLVQAFATLFFLSYTKLIFTIIIPFSVTHLVNQHGHGDKDYVPFIDPIIPFWHTKHIFLMASSIGILFLVIMPPILVLIAYPTKLFRKLQNTLSSRQNLAINSFVSPFQGCFKDGTNGTRDYRVLSGGVLAVLLLIMFLSYGAGCFFEVDARNPVILMQLTVAMMITLSVAFAVLRPYKSDVANCTGVTLTALIAICSLLYICLMDGMENWFITITALAVATSLPHFVFYGYLVYRIRQCRMKTMLQEWRCCYRKSENMTLLTHAY